MLATALLVLAPAAPTSAVAGEDLYELREQLATATAPAERVAILERIAALGPADAPPEEILDGVVACLEDSSALVRARAIELLGAPGVDAFRERASEALLGALARQLADEGALLERTRGRLTEALAADEQAGDAGNAFATLALEHAARQADLARTRTALTRALVARRSRRSLEALSGLLAPLHAEAADEAVRDALGSREPVARRADALTVGEAARAERSEVSEAADPIVAALVGLGSADALACALIHLELLEQDLEDGEDALRRARRERPRERTQGHVPSTDWATWEQRRLADLVAACEARVAATRARADALRASLATLADEHGLPRVPSKAFPARPWERWVEKAGRQLPSPEEPDGDEEER